VWQVFYFPPKILFTPPNTTGSVIHTRSVVLFGPSSAKYLGYAQNVNITSPKCQNCMNILEDWMTRCALNYAENEQCLAAITAPVVLGGVNKILGGK